MRIIGVQADIAWEQPGENYERVRRMLGAADLLPGALIVLPEMLPTGYSMNTAATVEPIEGPTRRFYAELAQRYQSFVVGGVTSCSAKEGCGRNEAIVADPSGAEVARYCKMRPMRVGGEINHYDRGEQVVTFDAGGFTVCPLICYDLRFPELFRMGAKAGAQLFVVIASWPDRRHAHWTALLRARAIENQAYIIGVNRCGDDPNHHYAGGSVAFDPQGNTIAELGDTPGILSVDADPAVVTQWRRDFPALMDLSC